MNHLYYGDNLPVLREHVADESVELIYLDPPFNSNASYNVLFRDGSGTASGAQIEAFDDTWVWDDLVSGRALEEVRDGPHQDAARMLDAVVGFLGKNAMTAYLSMMGVRLIELHRVLKPTARSISTATRRRATTSRSCWMRCSGRGIFGTRLFRSEPMPMVIRRKGLVI